MFDLLRKTREERKLSLEDVADALKIRCCYLKAIERGDYKNLPESVYAIGFIRSYAKFLGIEGDDMANELRRVLMQQSISENNYDEEVDEPSRSLSTDCSALFSRWQGCSSPRIAGVLLVIAVLAVLADLICGCFG